MPNKLEVLTKKRKNFLATGVLTILLWIIWATFFLFIPPELFGIPLIFLLVTFFVLLFTFSLIFAHTRRGILAASGVILAMILNYFGIGNYLNFVLIAGILFSFEYFLSNQ